MRDLRAVFFVWFQSIAVNITHKKSNILRNIRVIPANFHYNMNDIEKLNKQQINTIRNV